MNVTLYAYEKNVVIGKKGAETHGWDGNIGIFRENKNADDIEYRRWGSYSYRYSDFYEKGTKNGVNSQSKENRKIYAVANMPIKARYGDRIAIFFENSTSRGDSDSAYNRNTPWGGSTVYYWIYTYQAPGSSASGNLLVNGDASNGLNGWFEPLGGNEWVATTISEVPPISGPYFYPKNFKGLRESGGSWKGRGKYTILRQTVSIPASYAGRTLVLSADARGWAGQEDAAYVQIMVFDSTTASNSHLIAHQDSNYAQGGDWKKVKASIVVPKGTVMVQVSLFVHRLQGAVDGYIDNVTLTVQ